LHSFADFKKLRRRGFILKYFSNMVSPFLAKSHLQSTAKEHLKSVNIILHHYGISKTSSKRKIAECRKSLGVNRGWYRGKSTSSLYYHTTNPALHTGGGKTKKHLLLLGLWENPETMGDQSWSPKNTKRIHTLWILPFRPLSDE